MAVTHQQVFTMADIRVLAGDGLNTRTAEDYYARGFFRASIRSGSRGIERLFAFSDVFAAHLAASLRVAGYSLDVVGRAMALYHSQPPEPDRYILAIVDDEPLIVTPEEARGLMDRGVPVATVNLLAAAQDLREEIDDQLATVAAARAERN